MIKKSKVVLLPCAEYDEEKIYALLKEGLSLLGGIESLISMDKKILLKPNLLKKAEVEKAVITHPVVVGAFARILREKGYENIVLADSCGHGTTKSVIRGTGMDTYLKNTDSGHCIQREPRWLSSGNPGKGFICQRTAGAGLCDFPEQNENSRT